MTVWHCFVSHLHHCIPIEFHLNLLRFVLKMRLTMSIRGITSYPYNCNKVLVLLKPYIKLHRDWVGDEFQFRRRVFVPNRKRLSLTKFSTEPRGKAIVIDIVQKKLRFFFSGKWWYPRKLEIFFSRMVDRQGKMMIAEVNDNFHGKISRILLLLYLNGLRDIRELF